MPRQTGSFSQKTSMYQQTPLFGDPFPTRPHLPTPNQTPQPLRSRDVWNQTNRFGAVGDGAITIPDLDDLGRPQRNTDLDEYRLGAIGVGRPSAPSRTSTFFNNDAAAGNPRRLSPAPSSSGLSDAFQAQISSTFPTTGPVFPSVNPVRSNIGPSCGSPSQGKNQKAKSWLQMKPRQTRVEREFCQHCDTVFDVGTHSICPKRNKSTHRKTR